MRPPTLPSWQCQQQCNRKHPSNQCFPPTAHTSSPFFYLHDCRSHEFCRAVGAGDVERALAGQGRINFDGEIFEALHDVAFVIEGLGQVSPWRALCLLLGGAPLIKRAQEPSGRGRCAQEEGGREADGRCVCLLQQGGGCSMWRRAKYRYFRYRVTHFTCALMCPTAPSGLPSSTHEPCLCCVSTARESQPYLVHECARACTCACACRQAHHAPAPNEAVAQQQARTSKSMVVEQGPLAVGVAAGRGEGGEGEISARAFKPLKRRSSTARGLQFPRWPGRRASPSSCGARLETRDEKRWDSLTWSERCVTGGPISFTRPPHPRTLLSVIKLLHCTAVLHSNSTSRPKSISPPDKPWVCQGRTIASQRQQCDFSR